MRLLLMRMAVSFSSFVSFVCVIFIEWFAFACSIWCDNQPWTTGHLFISHTHTEIENVSNIFIKENRAKMNNWKERMNKPAHIDTVINWWSILTDWIPSCCLHLRAHMDSCLCMRCTLCVCLGSRTDRHHFNTIPNRIETHILWKLRLARPE